MTNPKMRSVGKTRLPTTDFRYDNELCLVSPTSKPTYDPDFAKWLVDERKSLDLSQIRLAQLSEISERTIRNWENGVTAPRGLEKSKMQDTLKRYRLSASLSATPISNLDSSVSTDQQVSASPKKASDSTKPATARATRTLSKVENKKVNKTVPTKSSKKPKEKKYDCSTCPLSKIPSDQTQFSQFVDGVGECGNSMLILGEAPGADDAHLTLILASCDYRLR